ncbi:MAG: hypothetical protein U0Y82_12045 [Thermoleophilia bacterium]
MFDSDDTTQLTLFIGGRPDPAPRATRRLGRNARMALQLDRMADDAELQAERLRAHGDQVGERRERERARDARRSAALLRAGPGGVARLLAS